MKKIKIENVFCFLVYLEKLIQANKRELKHFNGKLDVSIQKSDNAIEKIDNFVIDPNEEGGYTVDCLLNIPTDIFDKQNEYLNEQVLTLIFDVRNMHFYIFTKSHLALSCKDAAYRLGSQHRE
jgi:hypothetical protein